MKTVFLVISVIVVCMTVQSCSIKETISAYLFHRANVAVYEGDNEQLKKIMSYDLFDIHYIDSRHNTLLAYAVHMDNYDLSTIEIILDAKPSFHPQRDCFISSIFLESWEIVELFFSKGYGSRVCNKAVSGSYKGQVWLSIIEQITEKEQFSKLSDLMNKYNVSCLE